MGGIIDIWNIVLLQPMLNFLVILSKVFFGNFGLAIIVLTIVVNLLMFPLTLKQMRATKAIATLQPKLKHLQKKYAGDRQRLSQETMKLYKEAGVSPMGCALPLLLQFPIWIALYQSIIKTLAVAPEQLLDLSQRLYSLPMIHQAIPLGSRFLWLDLAYPDRFYILPILVGASMWVQQKMTAMPGMEQGRASLMQWMFPMMFVLLTMTFPSGLAIFWVASSVIRIAMQYFITGWGGLLRPLGQAVSTVKREPIAEERIPISEGEAPSLEKGISSGQRRGKRKDRRRGHRPRRK